jgi:hypothetical protein
MQGAQRLTAVAGAHRDEKNGLARRIFCGGLTAPPGAILA